MKVTIDPYAGFCFGVERAIRVAEENLFGEIHLHSLGKIVHNEQENQRLSGKGLKALDYENFMNLKQGRVLFRAHGEPPSSYKIACRNGTKVIDATCPVVRKLQSQVLKSHLEMQKRKGTVVIFGKKNHPEVIGLAGQTQNEALVVSSPDEIRNTLLPRTVRLFAQTTVGTEDYQLAGQAIQDRLRELYPGEKTDFKVFKTICGQVSGREKKIRQFAAEHSVIIFVAGKESSNGRHLFSICKEINPRSHYISGEDEILAEWFENVDDVGISGATSTPEWLLVKIGEKIESL